MPFWSSETLKVRLPTEGLVEPYDATAVVHCAYEIAMGSQAVITAKPARFRKKSRTVLADHEPIVIPPGQFGMLLTEEHIRVPADALAFISIRAGIKFDGLVNVSGFHVDPGFHGRLKFSVYNAGQKDIVICRGDRIFLIWYADLDRSTADLYPEPKSTQNEISAKDLARAACEVASPSQLKRQLEDLEQSLRNWKWMVGIFITIFASVLAGLVLMLAREALSKPNATEQQKVNPSAATSISAATPAAAARAPAIVMLQLVVPHPPNVFPEPTSTSALPSSQPTREHAP